MTTEYIIPRFEMFGPEFRQFMFGGADRYKNLAWKCDDMYKAFHTYFQITGKIFVMNCY